MINDLLQIIRLIKVVTFTIRKRLTKMIKTINMKLKGIKSKKN